MNLSYPHREALVVRNHELRVIRRLTGNPDIRVRAGERVTSDQVIARTDSSASAIKLPIADQLGIAPQDVSKCLMRPVGSSFSAGEALARARKGLRNVVMAAPVAGVLVSVDPATGVAALAPGGGDEVKALVAGDIEFVDGREAISVRTVGARMLGIVGFGDAVGGPLRVLVGQPNEELQPGKITPDLAGKIVVGGSWASAAALKKLVDVRAAAFITGGLVEREFADGFGLKSEDRLAPWRLGAGDRVLGESLSPGLSLMATEGFGPLAMHPDAFALLQEADGRHAVLFPYTRVTGDLMRPELIIPDGPAALDDDGQTSQAAFASGAHVRLTDQAALGKTATIVDGPRRSRHGDAHVFDVIDVELTDGTRRTVPIANVEILAGESAA
ncbi:MAG: hypothetical protein QOJ59_4874 [Thermomicrobiales bacterium]|jgi:hypothetical protein|nr:hypothetical protein [Thermomicrobiales bacterium]MEA2523688.1 hypothetical protein [Thermomicrobiales bacterium]